MRRGAALPRSDFGCYTMARRSLDPTRPTLSHTRNPLAQQARAPVGISALATGHFAIAVTYMLMLLSRSAAERTPAVWFSGVIPALLLCVSGAGLALRRGWGWWLTCAIYYAVFFNLPVGLSLWGVRGQPFDPLNNLLVFGLAVFLLVYLTRGELLRFIQFHTPDGRPRRLTLLTPVALGAAWALIHLLVRITRP